MSAHFQQSRGPASISCSSSGLLPQLEATATRWRIGVLGRSVIWVVVYAWDSGVMVEISLKMLKTMIFINNS